jgi:archaellum component FlaC
MKMVKQLLSSFSDEEIEAEYFKRTDTTLGMGINYYKSVVLTMEKELGDALNVIEKIDTDYKKLFRKYEDLESEYCLLNLQFIRLKKDYRKIMWWE